MTGALFHIVNHSVMKGAAFLGAGLVILKLGSGSVEAFNGLGRRMPVTAFAMAISFLALAGVPPLSGFWSKLLLFTSVLNTPYAWLAVAGVLNSALSMGYYGWVIKRMYLDEPDGEATRVKEPISFVLVLGVLVALIIAFGLFPGPVISFAQRRRARARRPLGDLKVPLHRKVRELPEERGRLVLVEEREPLLRLLGVGVGHRLQPGQEHPLLAPAASARR